MKNKQQSKRCFLWLILVATVVALLTSVLLVHTFATGETDEEDTTPGWGSVSLSLGENFDLRFYLKNAEPDDVSVSFERNGQVIENVTASTSDKGTYYAYTGITPQFFADEITATLTYTDSDGEKTVTYTASVESYCEKVKNSTSDEYTAAKPVVAAILAYGEAAKEYVAPTGAVTDVPNGDAVKVLYPTAVKGTDIRSAQLVLGNDIRMAFLLSDTAATGTAAVTVGNSQTTLTVSGGKIILPMKAADLLKKVTVVYEGSTVTYSVAQYVKNKLTDADSSNELKLLVARIYEYALSVHTYAGNTDDLVHVNVFEKATTEGGADVIRRSCAVCDTTLGTFGIMQKNTFDTTATNTTESGIKADGNNRYYRLSKTDATKTNENKSFTINIPLPDYLVFEIDIFLQKGTLTVSSDDTTTEQTDTWFNVSFGYKFNVNNWTSGALSVKDGKIYINDVPSGKTAKENTWYNVRTVYVKGEKQFYLYLDNEFIGTAATKDDALLADCTTVQYPNVSVGQKNQTGAVTCIDNVTFYTSETEHASHTWNNGKTMTNYTDTADGDLVLTCTACGETEHAVAHRLAFACAGEKMSVSCLNCQETLASLSAPTSTNKFTGSATVTAKTEKTKNGIMEVDGKKFQNLLDTTNDNNTAIQVRRAGADASDYSVLRFDFQLKESDIQKRKKEGTEWVNDGDPSTIDSSVYFVFVTYQTNPTDNNKRGWGSTFRIYINDDGKLAVKNNSNGTVKVSDIDGAVDTWYTLVCGYSQLQNRFFVYLNDGTTDHFVGAFDCHNANLPTEYNYFGYVNVFLGGANQIGERAWVDDMYIWLADDAK